MGVGEEGCGVRRGGTGTGGSEGIREGRGQGVRIPSDPGKEGPWGSEGMRWETPTSPPSVSAKASWNHTGRLDQDIESTTRTDNPEESLSCPFQCKLWSIFVPQVQFSRSRDTRPSEWDSVPSAGPTSGSLFRPHVTFFPPVPTPTPWAASVVSGLQCVF